MAKKDIERITGEERNPEIYADDIEMYLRLFQEEQNIDDMRTASQNIWNGALTYIYNHVFKNTDKLRTQPNNKNSYDIKTIDIICDKYIYLCQINDKEISIMGFHYLTGIDTECINNWAYNNNNYNMYNSVLDDDGEKLSTKRIGIYKKLMQSREESLSAKLATGNKNPVGIMAILNHHYSWNMPGVRETKQNQIDNRTAAEIAQEYNTIPDQKQNLLPPD